MNECKKQKWSAFSLADCLYRDMFLSLFKNNKKTENIKAKNTQIDCIDWKLGRLCNKLLGF